MIELQDIIDSRLISSPVVSELPAVLKKGVEVYLEHAEGSLTKYVGNNSNIPVRVGALPERWRVKFSDNTEWINSAEGFGGMIEFPDQTLGLFFRIGTEHMLTEAPLYFVRSKDRYGLEWNDKVLIEAIPNTDIRNGSVGIGEDGTIMGIFSIRTTESVYSDPALYYSQDGGETWTKKVLNGYADIGGNGGHGNIIELNDKYVATIYRNPNVVILGISKDFAKITTLKHYTLAADLDVDLLEADYTLTEPSIVKIDENTIFGFVRNNNGETLNALEFYSEDAGATWSTLKKSTVLLGKNTPIIQIIGDFAYLSFPSRDDSNGATFLDYWILSYKPVSELLNTEAHWLAPKKLFPLPDHSNGGGNVERGFIFERDDSFFLLWSEGSYMNEGLGGESVHFIKNIGKY